MDLESVFTRPKTAWWEYTRPVVSYVVLMTIGWLILAVLPAAPLWDTLNRAPDGGSSTLLVGLFHIALGAPLYLYATFHAPRIVEAFRAVQIREDEPTRLLTDGYYAQVRHPFYAMNILSIAGLMFSLCSAYPLILAILGGAIFYFNGYFDERQWLYPRFGDTYVVYARRVPARYFTPLTGTYLALLIVLSVAGIML
jgi:protein-S-isoprenylcysteine O-methyltransferase Ste14